MVAVELLEEDPPHSCGEIGHYRPVVTAAVGVGRKEVGSCFFASPPDPQPDDSSWGLGAEDVEEEVEDETFEISAAVACAAAGPGAVTNDEDDGGKHGGEVKSRSAGPPRAKTRALNSTA